MRHSDSEREIRMIKNRILLEQKKHNTLDWAEIAARKIYSSLVVTYCEHPFNKLHWVDNVVYCNQCGKTLHK